MLLRAATPGRAKACPGLGIDAFRGRRARFPILVRARERRKPLKVFLTRAAQAAVRVAVAAFERLIDACGLAGIRPVAHTTITAIRVGRAYPTLRTTAGSRFRADRIRAAVGAAMRARRATFAAGPGAADAITPARGAGAAIGLIDAPVLASRDAGCSRQAATPTVAAPLLLVAALLVPALAAMLPCAA